VSTAHDRWMISSIWCYHSRGLDCSRPILLLLTAWSLPAGLRRCCCRVNVTLFSHVTLTRKPQSTSDLDHFHARELPRSRVKSRDDPISGRRGDSRVLYCFIYKDRVKWCHSSLWSQYDLSIMWQHGIQCVVQWQRFVALFE